MSAPMTTILTFELKALERELADWKSRALAAEAKLDELRREISEMVPYVLATLPYPSKYVTNTSVTTSDPEWSAVHRGRAGCSYSWLESLLAKVKP